MTPLWRARWRGSPLRRRSDILQNWIGLVLFVSLLATVPLTTALVGGAVHTSLDQTARQQVRAGHHTTAVLLHDAPQHLEPGSDESRHVRYPVEVRFHSPDGTSHTGTADVRPGTPVGSTVEVWADADHGITDPPLTPAEIRLRAEGWAAAAGGAVAVAGCLLHAAVARVLDRHRLLKWGREWATVAPSWTTPT